MSGTLGLNWKEYIDIVPHSHPALMEPLYVLIWKGTVDQVYKTGGFVDKQSAEWYIEENLQKCLDKRFEQEILE